MSRLKSFDFDESITNRSSASIKKMHMSSDEEDVDDLEFDDTNLETPRSIKRGVNSSSSNTIHRNFTVKNTSIKVPLNDEDDGTNQSVSGRKRSIVSTPLIKYRSRNGTPLRQPPITSGHISSNNEEVDLIRESKLISDDNKFSPKEHFKNLSSPRKSPLRSRNNNEIVWPPANLKMSPLDFSNVGNGNKEKKTEAVQIPRDIEFDASDGEDVSKRNISTNFTRVPRVTEEQASKDDQINGIDYDGESDSLSAHENDISRAEILEKINATIQSIREREMTEKSNTSRTSRKSPVVIARSGSPAISSNKDREERSPTPQPNHNALLESASISDNEHDYVNEDILNELDSYLPPPDPQPQSEPQLFPSLLPKAPENELNSPQRGTDNDRLSQKYARNILRGRRKTVLEKEKEKGKEADWPAYKWSKLHKIIKLKKLSIGDIVNSTLIREGLGATRQELASRAKFLVEVEKKLEQNSKHTRKLPRRRGKIGAKSPLMTKKRK